MDQRTRRTVLIATTALVWAAALGVGISRFKLAAKASVTISLATRPPVVRISVDGEKQDGGAWLETPRKLMLTPGRHKVKISRDGYVAHVVTIEGDAGDTFRMEDVVLDRSQSVLVAGVEVSTAVPGDSALHVEIDDGLVHGETPLTATDLTAEQQHSLTVFPKWPEKGGAVHCRFTPPPTPDGDESAVYKILVRSKNGKLKFNGCERPSTGGAMGRRKS